MKKVEKLFRGWRGYVNEQHDTSLKHYIDDSDKNNNWAKKLKNKLSLSKKIKQLSDPSVEQKYMSGSKAIFGFANKKWGKEGLVAIQEELKNFIDKIGGRKKWSKFLNWQEEDETGEKYFVNKKFGDDVSSDFFSLNLDFEDMSLNEFRQIFAALLIKIYDRKSLQMNTNSFETKPPE